MRSWENSNGWKVNHHMHDGNTMYHACFQHNTQTAKDCPCSSQPPPSSPCFSPLHGSSVNILRWPRILVWILHHALSGVKRPLLSLPPGGLAHCQDAQHTQSWRSFAKEREKYCQKETRSSPILKNSLSLRSPYDRHPSCLNCGAEMTPHHQCDTTDSDSNWEDVENENDLYPTLECDSEDWAENFTNNIRAYHGISPHQWNLENFWSWRPQKWIFPGSVIDNWLITETCVQGDGASSF